MFYWFGQRKSVTHINAKVFITISIMTSITTIISITIMIITKAAMLPKLG